ncbi:MAG: hypothetical protein HUU20_25175 [Pirellulales bacterium]|nr:hypothetical protein [Pirellulales bacterium]
METSLHRDLKTLYAGEDPHCEVKLGSYRIDAVSGDQLVEIQHGSLAAIRDKVRRLLESHRVLVVKPIVVQKLLVKQACEGGRVTERRMSPKQGRLLDVFDDLVYFTRVFPHRRLTIDVALVDIEEWRYPGHGRRRRWRSRDHQVSDQKLLSVREIHRLKTTSDLASLMPASLPRPFHTGHLATSLQVPRWVAQRIAYCLRQTGTAEQVGKLGNALLYEMTKARRKPAA